MLVRSVCRVGQCTRSVFDWTLAAHRRRCKTACSFYHHKKEPQQQERTTEGEEEGQKKFEKTKENTLSSLTSHRFFCLCAPPITTLSYRRRRFFNFHMQGPKSFVNVLLSARRPLGKPQRAAVTRTFLVGDQSSWSSHTD